jgi:hypothetical protein
VCVFGLMYPSNSMPRSTIYLIVYHFSSFHFLCIIRCIFYTFTNKIPVRKHHPYFCIDISGSMHITASWLIYSYSCLPNNLFFWSDPSYLFLQCHILFWNLSSPSEWRFNTWFKRSLSHVVATLLYLIPFAQQLEVLTLSYLSFLNINFHIF